MTTNINSIHPGWVQTLKREGAVRRALVLDGNVQDTFYDPEQREYVILSEWLRRIFSRDQKLGFTMAGVWDQTDGLRFADDKTLKRFKDALGGDSDSQNGQAYDTGDQRAAKPANCQLYTEPSDLFAAMRQVLDNKNERPVFILDYSQYMVTQSAHPDPGERQWMRQMGKAITGSDVISVNSDSLKNNGGLIIFLTTNLGKVPPILYQYDPRIKLISLPSPSRPQRRDFFARHMDDLRCERPKSSNQAESATTVGREELADMLADMTDQLKTNDLIQLLSLSLHTETSLQPDKLLNLYRLGDHRSPWEELSRDKLERVEDILKERVIGQDPAVHHAATMIIRAYMGLGGLQHNGKKTKPKGKMFFVGPTGVGKTELAKAIAEFLFGDESAFIRFDMSEFSQEHSDQRLIGAPPGYVGFEEGGQLTNAIKKRPFCVLLFDEIEKAHGRILDKFLQILEDGRLTDGRGETVHFSECVIIFTSNIGASSIPTTNDCQELRKHFLSAVETHFDQELKRPELRNRLGENIVVFDNIEDEGIRRSILKKGITPITSYLNDRFGIVPHLTPDVENSFLASSNSGHGGRGLVNVIEDRLANPLSWYLFEREHQLRRGRTIDITINGDDISFELQEGAGHE